MPRLAEEAELQNKGIWRRFLAVLTVVGLILGLIINAFVGLPSLACITSAQACNFSLSSPRVNDQIRLNLVNASLALKNASEPAPLDIEIAAYAFGPDKVFVATYVDGDKVPIDIIDTRSVAQTAVSRFPDDGIFVVSYPSERRFRQVNHRLKFYRTKGGLETADVNLSCRADARPEIELQNLRYTKTPSQFSFDLISNCTFLTDPTRGEIDFGETKTANTRVKVLFDDRFVPVNLSTSRGDVAHERRMQDWEWRRDAEDRCEARLVEKGTAQFGDMKGWIGDCLRVQDLAEGSRIPTISGYFYFYDGSNRTNDEKPKLSSHYVSCLHLEGLRHEFSADSASLFLFCPKILWTTTTAGGRDHQIEAEVLHYNEQGSKLKVEFSCECGSLEVRSFRLEEDQLFFELASDSSTIRINGTPHKLGRLPSGHDSGEPYFWGEHVIQLTNGGLVANFNKAG